MAHNVFISCSTKDLKIAEAVCETLEASEIRCWYAKRDLSPGSDWHEELMAALKQSRVMIVIWSTNSAKSKDVTQEVKHAYRGNLVIIPFRVEEVEWTPSLVYYMDFIQWLNAFPPPYKDYLQRLPQLVRDKLESSNPQNDSALLSSGDPGSAEHSRSVMARPRCKSIRNRSGSLSQETSSRTASASEKQALIDKVAQINFQKELHDLAEKYRSRLSSEGRLNIPAAPSLG